MAKDLDKTRLQLTSMTSLGTQTCGHTTEIWTRSRGQKRLFGPKIVLSMGVRKVRTWVVARRSGSSMTGTKGQRS